MPYRVLLKNSQGESTGYENVELSPTEFAAVIQGQQPASDLKPDLIRAGVFCMELRAYVADALPEQLEQYQISCWREVLP
jgi:hypothetical protein